MVLTSPPSEAMVFERVNRSARFSSAAGLHQLSFQAMSTACQMRFRAAGERAAREFQEETLGWVAAFEARYSRFLPDSLISRINAAAGRDWVEVDAESDALFNLCQEMVFLTRGVFDPTALPLIRLWNWKADPPVIPEDAAIQAVRELVGWGKVRRRAGAVFLPQAGMCLDLGGIGKEYAVDRVAGLAWDRGIADVLVDFGQDVRALGAPPGKPAWHIGLDDPAKPGNCWTGLAATNQGVATSGDYLRRFIHQGRRYGHIIDPRDGYPVNNGMLSVSVIAPNCTIAGILSTAAFALGLKEGADLIARCSGAEGCLTDGSGRHQTKGFYAHRTS
jgi:thiamine biosynthesis lipoprotein